MERFSEALSVVAAEHAAAVSALQKEISALRDMLGDTESNALDQSEEQELNGSGEEHAYTSTTLESYGVGKKASVASMFDDIEIRRVSCTIGDDISFADDHIDPLTLRFTGGPRARVGPPPAVAADNNRELRQSSPGKMARADSHTEFDAALSSKRSMKTLAMITEVVSINSTGRTQRRSLRPQLGFLNKIWQQMKMDATTQLMIIDSVVGIAILVNTVLLGVSADVAPDWIGWLAIDCLFALIFLLEFIGKSKILGLTDYFCGYDMKSNVFDFCLLLLAIFEVVMALLQKRAGLIGSGNSTQFLSLLRIARLSRVLRIARVLRLEMFNELKTMVRGTVGGMKTLFWSAVLIALPVYAASLVFRETLGSLNDVDYCSDYFDSVPRSIFSVFRCVIIGECADRKGRPVFVVISETYGMVYGALYCALSAFMIFGLFNVIGAMFVENVVIACKERDVQTRKENLRSKDFFTEKMASLLQIVFDIKAEDKGYDVDFDDDSGDVFHRASRMEITPDIFERFRHDPHAQKILDDLDVADDDQHNLFAALDADKSGTIDLEEFCSGIARLRGDPCRSDIISIMFKIENVQSELNSVFFNFGRRLKNIEKTCGMMRQSQQVVCDTDFNHWASEAGM